MDKFVTTLARDLAAQNERISEVVAATLISNLGLATTSDFARQFDELILPAAHIWPEHLPYVIVIDALDEAYDPEAYNAKAIELFTKRIPALPGNFRIVVTSRPHPLIVSELRGKAHVTVHALNAVKDAEADLRIFISRELVTLALQKGLAIDWPDEVRKAGLIKKAEGLFLWASLALKYLAGCSKPDRQLSVILSLQGAPGVGQHMDSLFKAVLDGCPYKSDPDFAESYKLYMSTIIGAKEALSVSAIASLHQIPAPEVQEVLGHLASLLTGLDTEDKAVRLIHLSFREYITLRAPEELRLTPENIGRSLALPCIMSLVEYLTSPEAAALQLTDTETLPTIAIGGVPEDVVYACHFWVDHILELNSLSSELRQGVVGLCAQGGLQSLVPLAIRLGVYRSLASVPSCLQVRPYDALPSSQ